MRPLPNLLVSNLLCTWVSGIIIVALPLYLLQLGLSLHSVSYVYAIGLVVNGVLMYLLGSLTDTHGRLKSGILTLIGIFISVIIFGLLPLFDALALFWIAMIAKMLLSFSETSHYNIARMRVMDLGARKEMGYILGLLVFAGSVGYSIGLFCGSLLIKFISLQKLLFVCAAILVISLFFYMRTGESKILLKTPKDILRRRGFKNVLYLEVITTGIIVLVDFFGLPIFQSEVLGLSTQQIFLSIGIAWLGYGILSPFGGKLYDKIGAKAHIIALVLIAITSLLLPYAKTWVSFTTLLLIDYAFFSVADPARHTLIALVSGKHKGKAVSLMDMWAMIFAAVGIFLFVPLIEHLSYHAMFILRAIMHLLSIFFVLRIAKDLRSKVVSTAPVLDIHH